MRETFGRNGATGREEGLGSDLSAVEGIRVVEDERAAVEVPVDLLEAQHVEHGRPRVRRGEHRRRVAAVVRRTGSGDRRRITATRRADSRMPPAGRARRESAMTPEQVIAREAIIHTQSVYNTEGDRGRVEDLVQTFTEDGILELDRGVFSGREEISRALSAAVADKRQEAVTAGQGGSVDRIFLRHNLTTRR